MAIRTTNRATALAAILSLFAILSASADEGDDLTKVNHLISQGRIEEARVIVESFESRNPESGQVPWLWLALARGETQLFSRRARLREVSHRFPGSPAAADALYELIELAYLSGDAGETMRLARTFYQTQPAEARTAAVMRMEARLMMARGRYAAAREKLDAAAAHGADPGDEALSLVVRAEQLLLENKPEQAIRYLERAVESGQGDVADAAFRLGEAAYLDGRKDLAARMFATILERFPDSLYAGRARARLERIGPTAANPAANE